MGPRQKKNKFMVEYPSSKSVKLRGKVRVRFRVRLGLR